MGEVAFSAEPPEHLITHPHYIPANHHYEPHTHEYHELILLQQGRLRVQIASKMEQFAGPGDILLYPAGCVHEEWAEDGEPVLTWVCDFRWSALGPTHFSFCHDTHGRVQELIAKLTWEFRMEADKREVFLAPLQALLAELNLLSAPEHKRMVDRVRAYISAHFREPFTLDDLVAISGLSKSYFVKQYRQVTGRAPMEDVRFWRLEEARRLILSSSLPLYEIASMVGIQDVYRLSHLLKTYLNVSARELRQAGRQRE